MSQISFEFSFTQLMDLTCVELLGYNARPRFWEACLPLIEACLDGGDFDPNACLGGQGQSAVVRWSEKQLFLPSRLLAKIGEVHPTLGPPDNQGLLPFHGCMAQRDAGFEYLLDWIQGAPLQALLIDDPANGATFFKPLLKSKFFRENQDIPKWEAVLQALEDRGVNWKSPLPSLVELKSPWLLAAMVRKRVELSDRFEVGNQTTCLWKTWGQLGHAFLAREMSVSPVLSPVDKRGVVVANYFSKFLEIRKNHVPPKELLGYRSLVWNHLRSREDWFSLKDSHGKSALFYAMQCEPGILRLVLESCSKAETQQALSHVDNLQRGVWFYLLPVLNSNTVTEKLLDSLRAFVPPRFSESGLGWKFLACQNPLATAEAWKKEAWKKEAKSTQDRFTDYEFQGSRSQNYRSALLPGGWSTEGLSQAEVDALCKSSARSVVANPQFFFNLMNDCPPDGDGALRLAKVWSRVVSQPRFRVDENLALLRSAVDQGASFFPVTEDHFHKAKLSDDRQSLDDLNIGFNDQKSFKEILRIFRALSLQFRLSSIEAPVAKAPKPRL